MSPFIITTFKISKLRHKELNLISPDAQIIKGDRRSLSHTLTHSLSVTHSLLVHYNVPPQQGIKFTKFYITDMYKHVHD